MDANNQQDDRETRPPGGEWISAVANLSIQYNIGVIAPALLLLDPSRAGASDKDASLYPRSDETDSMLKSAVFCGAILGQCTMGIMGDMIGLELAMILTNALALVGTIGCTVAPLWGNSADSVYSLLAVSRAVLGVGVGGKYPLASAMRAKSATEHDNEQHRAKEVARGFFWQTPGAILPYLVSTVLLWLLGEPNESNGRVTQLQYMVLVGLGAIPSLLALVGTANQLLQERNSVRSNAGEEESAIARHWYRSCFVWMRPQRGGYQTIQRNSPILIALRNRSSWRKLAGTGLSWALYDFIYYGTAFNLPEIFSRVLGGGEDLLTDSWHNALISLMGIPGVVLAIQMMEPLGGPKILQWWGFVSIGFASFLVALSYNEDESAGGTGAIRSWIAVVACSFLIFTINWGCNVSTYVLPIEVFPRNVCSTFHGFSAGMGKCGAALGGFFFTKLNAVSVSLTFTVCIACCTLGAFITRQWIDDLPSRRAAVLTTKDSSSSLRDEAELTTMLGSPPIADQL